MVLIRPEQSSDRAAIRHVNEQAFKRPDEANLVECLREAGKTAISLVATCHQPVVGHILFSPVSIEFNNRRIRGLGLAPLAVLTEYQQRGIGSQLVHHGLEVSKEQGYDLVVVLGHKEYYSRFGFRRASVYGLRNEYQADESFRVLELRTGTLNTVSGLVKYPSEFVKASQ
jgi:putative acetyltransferase